MAASADDSPPPAPTMPLSKLVDRINQSFRTPKNISNTVKIYAGVDASIEIAAYEFFYAVEIDADISNIKRKLTSLRYAVTATGVPITLVTFNKVTGVIVHHYCRVVHDGKDVPNTTMLVHLGRDLILTRRLVTDETELVTGMVDDPRVPVTMLSFVFAATSWLPNKQRFCIDTGTEPRDDISMGDLVSKIKKVSNAKQFKAVTDFLPPDVGVVLLPPSGWSMNRRTEGRVKFVIALVNVDGTQVVVFVSVPSVAPVKCE